MKASSRSSGLTSARANPSGNESRSADYQRSRAPRIEYTELRAPMNRQAQRCFPRSKRLFAPAVTLIETTMFLPRFGAANTLTGSPSSHSKQVLLLGSSGDFRSPLALCLP